jgi:23S rRNA A2030 N6-methylase RlmJ
MNERHLFTLILDWRGGTYVSQVWAGSPEQATVLWAQQHLLRSVIELDPEDRSRLQRDLESGERRPTRLADTDNVWCATTLLDGDLACLHVVKTQALQ